MCTWKRIKNLDRTLELLDKQKNLNFIFYIWNNNPDIEDVINKKIEIEHNFKIKVRHSPINIGGFGRFKFAKYIADEHDKIIFIDDDQVFNENMVNIFHSNYDENAIKSRWAFRFRSSNYTDRYQVFEDNQNVHYCGTGGMILPSKVFKCEELYIIPNEFSFVEDLWLCFVGNHYLNMKLRAIQGDFMTQIVDGKDQSTIDFITTKNKFLQYLIKIEEWQILKT